MVGSRTWLMIWTCALAVSCGGEPPESASTGGETGAGGRTAAGVAAPFPKIDVETEDPTASSRNFSVRDLPDPAMARDAAAIALGAEAGTGSAAADPEPGRREEPDRFTVDAENGRVFILGRGWITAEDFWDMYHNRPQELPGDLDHEALNRIRPSGG